MSYALFHPLLSQHFYVEWISLWFILTKTRVDACWNCGKANRVSFGEFYFVSVEFERSLLYYGMQGKLLCLSMESAGFEELNKR